MGNYLMAFGALIIFGIFSLLTNKSLLNNKKVAMESEFIITATSLGQSVIEEAKNKAFDEKTLSDTVTVVNSLSTTLGPDGSEATNVTLPDNMVNNSFRSANFYNDVDDYNGYRRIVNTPLSGVDTIRVQVVYVNQTSPYGVSAGKTWCKRMTVTVTSAFISVPIALTYIFSYYK
jgi:hypothetical protein